MPIKTIAEKKAHPLYSKIPDSMWIIHFEQFDDDSVRLNNKPFSEITRSDLPENVYQASIILLLSYPDVPASSLYNYISNTLRLDNQELFDFSCQLNRINMLNILKQEAPAQLAAMIAVNNYEAFRSASENGHLEILQWLKQEAPAQFAAMVAARDYLAFRFAGENGHLKILEWLKQEAPAQLAAMVAAVDYEAFHFASQRGHHDVAKWLLETGGNALLEHVESHHAERNYQLPLSSFVNEKLTAIHQERDAALVANANAIFDINDADKVQQCFYMMRNLIRRNDPALNQELRLLLDIPAVKALAHQADNTGENALIRLAISSGNNEASSILLNIEAVRLLAQQNNFYRDAIQSGVDLAQLAANRESSMTALTPGEAKRLKTAVDRYEPMLKQAGISHIMNDLRDNLIERYTANPATITINDRLLKLPIEYKDFKALNLQGEDLQNALVAYYQQADHTALRYLSKPNSWMHENASYVNINDDRTERWSTFDDYQDLISMLYVATIDKQSEPIEGHTFDTRLEMFIIELALIGRAHNWDDTRFRNGKEEEYDNLQADKPSCFSGVKRRLFQSIHGHTLFSILTQDIVRKVLFKEIQEHFKETFKEEHRVDLAAALACVTDYDDIPEDVFKRLSSLNLSEEKIEKIIEKMAKDFSEKFGDDAFFPYINFVKEQFKLPEDNLQEDKRMTHLMKFYYGADLERVLKDVMKVKEVKQVSESKPSVAGSFGSHKRSAKKVITSKENEILPSSKISKSNSSSSSQ